MLAIVPAAAAAAAIAGWSSACFGQVVMPRNAVEAKGLLLASIREPDPVIFFEPKILYRTSVEDVPDGDYEVPLGVADIMREGTDVTLVRKGRGRGWKRSYRHRFVQALFLAFFEDANRGSAGFGVGWRDERDCLLFEASVPRTTGRDGGRGWPWVLNREKTCFETNTSGLFQQVRR